MKKTLVALSLAAMTLPALAQDKKAPEPDYREFRFIFRLSIQGNFSDSREAGLAGRF